MSRTPHDDGFDEAFDELFPLALRLARRIVGSAAQAEDVAAEALARAFARWPKVRDLPHRDAWVMRVATNLALDHVRRRPPTNAAPATGVDDGDQVAMRLALVAALRHLPRRQRQAVALRYLADLSEDQTAAALGVRPGTVKTHLHRGIQTLRAHLGTSLEVPDAPVG